MCSNKPVCTSIKYVCSHPPTCLYMYVIHCLFPGPSIDRVSGGVGGACLFEQWQSPAVCARHCSRGQTGVEVSFYVKQ